MIVRLKIKTLRFDEKTFCGTTSGFPPYWDNKKYVEYYNEKI